MYFNVCGKWFGDVIKYLHNNKLQLTAGSATVFRGHFLSMFSMLPEFIEHLPASTELGVSKRDNL